MSSLFLFPPLPSSSPFLVGCTCFFFGLSSPCHGQDCPEILGSLRPETPKALGPNHRAYMCGDSVGGGAAVAAPASSVVRGRGCRGGVIDCKLCRLTFLVCVETMTFNFRAW